MDNGLAMVVVALVTTVGGIVVAVIHSFRKENRKDHAEVSSGLLSLSLIALRTEQKVDTVKDELHEHLGWHTGGTTDEPRKST
jgi:hypothetical protein